MSSYAGFLAYRVKMQPQDFCVEEESTLPIQKHGPFTVYELKKSDWNTVDALLQVQKRFHVPLKLFNYGGKKDRHAFTRQLITVQDSRDLSFQSDHFSFTRIGCSDRPMIPELIQSNRFRLCVRNILERELPSIESALSRINAMGFPNYFDDQRFASYHPVAGFAFLSLFRGDPESALRFTLLSPYGGEKTHAKKRKKAIHDLWGQWKECLDLSQTSMERMVIQELKKRLGASKTKAQMDKVFLETMDRLPREELSMGFSALQSWIFNESLARAIRDRNTQKGGLQSVDIKTKTGDLAFPIRDGQELDSWKGSHYHLIGPGQPATTDGSICGQMREWEDRLLEILEISRQNLEKRYLRSAFLKSHQRPIWCQPELTMENVRKDSLNDGKLCYDISFSLPRGAYATMAMKALHLRIKER